MKRIALITVSIILTLHVYAQTNGDEYKMPKQSLPTDPANYRLSIDIQERDLNGTLLRQIIDDGKIIELSRISMNDNTFQLKDVSQTMVISGQEQYTQIFNELEELDFKILGDNFTNLDFYKNCLPSQVDLVRMFIQDKVAFEAWGQMYLDSLEINVPFYPDFFQNQSADFEQSVNFTTQKLSITWLGYSKINGKDCMLVYFKSMYSPYIVDNDMVVVNGRSCFWGNIWILPDTRQIKYAIMNEDIVSHTKFKANDFELQHNSQREVTYEKID